jgi:hypothetical protein
MQSQNFIDHQFNQFEKFCDSELNTPNDDHSSYYPEYSHTQIKRSADGKKIRKIHHFSIVFPSESS